MNTSYAPPGRGTTLRRGKTLIRPERQQPNTPLLTGKKERKPLDPWVIFSRVVTIWAPNTLLSSIGGLHDKMSQQAWREKVALCLIAVFMGAIVAFLTIGFRPTLCPADQADNAKTFFHYGDSNGSYCIFNYCYCFDYNYNNLNDYYYCYI